jgi:hypothetical protein
MDQKTREHYRKQVRDVKCAVFVAEWVREMFDALDGEIERLQGVLSRIADHRHASAIDPGGDATLLKVIETIEEWARAEVVKGAG